MNESKIIYIIGAGRSGTTLLDIILGNAENIFSAGELNRYTRRNGEPHNPRDENVSGFWRGIKTKLAENGFSDPETFYKLSSEFEYHGFFPKVLFFYNNKKFQLYKRFQQNLFSIIQTTVQNDFKKEIILDSSKYPLRGFFLSKIFGKNISFIYISRHPLAVAESFQAKNIEQPSKKKLAAHAYLLGVNKLALMVLKKLQKHNKISTISYEGLSNNPLNELTKIEADLHIDLSLPKKKIKENLPLQVGYLFDGNRLRSEPSIVFKNAMRKTSINKISDRIFVKLHKLIWFRS